MPTLWQQDNFSLGIHTRPGQIENGESYAADEKNLRIDEQGWLTLRENFQDTGPATGAITGIDSSDNHLFVLHGDRFLSIRPITDPFTPEAVLRLPVGSGRLSVVSTYSDYVMLTTEGEDQGYWINMRDGETRQIHSLGLSPPSPPSITSTLPPFDTEFTAFVAYAFTYVRNFPTEIGEKPPDELFNGMESELSVPQIVLTKEKTTFNPTFTLSDFVLALDARWDWTNGSFVNVGEMGWDGTRLIVSIVDNDGRNWRTEMGVALPKIPNAIVLAERAPGVSNVDGTVDSVNLTNAHLELTLHNDVVVSSTLQAGQVVALVMGGPLDRTLSIGEYYPALIDGFTHSTDPQVTGINVYRSIFLRKTEIDPDLDDDELAVITENNAAFDRLLVLARRSDPNLNIATLLFRRVAYIERGNTDPFYDGVDEEGLPYIEVVGEERQRYTWNANPPVKPGFNARLPKEAKSLEYHNDRLFAPTGDSLVYSDIEFGSIRPWVFLPTDVVKRIRPGRLDFARSFREVLLFGGRDGLFRLEGIPENFSQDDISRIGPLDAYAWSATKNTLAFVGENGFYSTDASTVEYLSDMSLDTFFKSKRARRGIVLFFSDNTFLFSVGLQPVEGGDVEDYIFRYEKGFWTRWADQSIVQATVSGEDWSQYWIAPEDGARIQELEWNEENNDDELEWSFTSNWISGRRAGVQNIAKQFQEFLISAQGGTEMMLETWTNKDSEPRIRMFTSRDDTYYQRIPIQRYAELLRFRLSGVGPLQIRGIQIES